MAVKKKYMIPEVNEVKMKASCVLTVSLTDNLGGTLDNENMGLQYGGVTNDNQIEAD